MHGFMTAVPRTKHSVLEMCLIHVESSSLEKSTWSWSNTKPGFIRDMYEQEVSEKHDGGWLLQTLENSFCENRSRRLLFPDNRHEPFYLNRNSHYGRFEHHEILSLHCSVFSTTPICLLIASQCIVEYERKSKVPHTSTPNNTWP